MNLPKVKEGDHRLVLHREGFDSIEAAISVKAGELNLYQYEMKR